jgi:peroxiredoxin
VINASRWGEDSMEELFYAFLSKAYLIMLTDDITNTYTSLQESTDFEKVTPKNGGFVFTGNVDAKSPKYLALLKIAATLGDAGISNYMPAKVKLVVDKYGIASQWVQYNLKNETVVEAKLTDIVVNGPLVKNVFTFQPPKDIIVMDIGQALQRDRIHIKHPLLKNKAPKMKIQYLAGKKKTVKPGSQPIVLTFFASWSGNSRKYLGNVDKLYGKYNLRGVKFITITDETETGKIKDFINDEKLTLPIYIDPDKKTIENYGVHVVPKTFVIDKNGIVVDVIEGNAPGTLSALKQTIEKTLK